MELESSEFDGAFMKRENGAARPPRRRRNGTSEAESNEPQKKQGWGFGEDGDGDEGGQAEGISSTPVDKHFGGGTDASDSLPVIPDLEEEADEDMSRQVAEAPRAAHARFQTIHELEHDSTAFSLPSTSGGVELSLLHGVLLPQPMVVEPDEHWDTDVLFTSVAGDLRAFNEEEKDEEEEKENDKSGRD
mmetsp:Transcript_8929/g.24349  ORF Transcript_8929/g.24349 Transcript_8929/m.24349 type:complete len:189 (-) Transcript_8929:82-648(-)